MFSPGFDQNDVSDIPYLTFSMDADEEKHILYEKTEVREIRANACVSTLPNSSMTYLVRF